MPSAPNPPAPSPTGKDEWRRHLRAIRDAASAIDRHRWSKAACQHVLAQGVLRPHHTLAAFAAFRSEADPADLVNAHRAQGGRTVFPKVIGDHLRWFEADPATLRPVPPWQIREPVEAIHRPVDPEEIEAWIVPGLGFTPLGYRIGYGKGYYDRVLGRVVARTKTAGFVVGFGFGLQVVPSLPLEPHDVCLPNIVTEAGWRQTGAGD